MQLALLSGANPRNCKHGPVVRLIPGKYRLSVQGLVDSILLMHTEAFPHGSEILGSGDSFIEVCDKPTSVQLSFSVRGNENYITVVANKVA